MKYYDNEGQAKAALLAIVKTKTTSAKIFTWQTEHINTSQREVTFAVELKLDTVRESIVNEIIKDYVQNNGGLEPIGSKANTADGVDTEYLLIKAIVQTLL